MPFIWHESVLIPVVMLKPLAGGKGPRGWGGVRKLPSRSRPEAGIIFAPCMSSVA